MPFSTNVSRPPDSTEAALPLDAKATHHTSTRVVKADAMSWPAQRCKMKARKASFSAVLAISTRQSSANARIFVDAAITANGIANRCLLFKPATSRRNSAYSRRTRPAAQRHVPQSGEGSETQFHAQAQRFPPGEVAEFRDKADQYFSASTPMLTPIGTGHVVSRASHTRRRVRQAPPRIALTRSPQRGRSRQFATHQCAAIARE